MQSTATAQAVKAGSTHTPDAMARHAAVRLRPPSSAIASSQNTNRPEKEPRKAPQRRVSCRETRGRQQAGSRAEMGAAEGGSREGCAPIALSALPGASHAVTLPSVLLPGAHLDHGSAIRAAGGCRAAALHQQPKHIGHQVQAASERQPRQRAAQRSILQPLQRPAFYDGLRKEARKGRTGENGARDAAAGATEAATGGRRRWGTTRLSFSSSLQSRHRRATRSRKASAVGLSSAGDIAVSQAPLRRLAVQQGGKCAIGWDAGRRWRSERRTEKQAKWPGRRRPWRQLWRVGHANPADPAFNEPWLYFGYTCAHGMNQIDLAQGLDTLGGGSNAAATPLAPAFLSLLKPRLCVAGFDTLQATLTVFPRARKGLHCATT